MDRTASDPLIGRVLDGRYRIGPRIARGGMATVYEATDERLDRRCAVKVMHQGMGDDEQFAKRFVREARSAARLSHPNVVSVFDQGDDHGTLFLVMEHIPGNTLRDRIRTDAPLKPREALALLDPLLGALGAAHASSMIHRDVKPENVLLAPDGRVKVADFGLARAINAETQHTATGGVLIGTVSYLAPELVVESKADARSDVYAAGVILYEMLTGRKPHEGDTPIQVAYKHVHEDVPPPSAAVPGIPAYLDALVARATARDRDQRPTDARAFQQLLRRVRTAIDAGVTDDPELTADLLPRTPVAGAEPDIDYHDEDVTVPVVLPRATSGAPLVPSVPLAPSVPLVATGTEHTSVIEHPEIDELEPIVVERPEPAATADLRPPAQHGAPAEQPPEPPQPSLSDQGPAGGKPKNKPKSKRSRRGPILLAIILALAIAAAVGGWYLGVGRYTTTPGVSGLAVSTAKARIEKAGLSFTVVDQQYSETVDKGAVISTDPTGGARIVSGGTVEAIESMGPERHAVPVVKGLTVDAASEKLENRHLAVGRVKKVWNETVAKGIVIRSIPAANTELKRDTPVRLTVSKGPAPIHIKDYQGKRYDVAAAELTELGLKPSKDEAYSEDVAAGRVISQSPGTDKVLHKGDTVKLVVSLGPPLVEVPDVVTDSVDDATQELEDAGFDVKVEKSATYIGIDRVLSQSPGSGKQLPKGSTVTIYLV
ncbi:MAG: PASTA domain-containing protein [Nocardioidaceae bacterium]